MQFYFWTTIWISYTFFWKKYYFILEKYSNRPWKKVCSMHFLEFKTLVDIQQKIITNVMFLTCENETNWTFSECSIFYSQFSRILTDYIICLFWDKGEMIVKPKPAKNDDLKPSKLYFFFNIISKILEHIMQFYFWTTIYVQILYTFVTQIWISLTFFCIRPIYMIFVGNREKIWNFWTPTKKRSTSPTEISRRFKIDHTWFKIEHPKKTLSMVRRFSFSFWSFICLFQKVAPNLF